MEKRTDHETEEEEEIEVEEEKEVEEDVEEPEVVVIVVEDVVADLDQQVWEESIFSQPGIALQELKMRSWLAQELALDST